MDYKQDRWIHGDLGSWNILHTTENNVCLIDFSEARKGPRYFDLAAVFLSYMPYSIDSLPIYTDNFIQLYNKTMDLKEFKQTLELWFVKGVLVSLEITRQSKEQINYFFNMLEYFNL